MKVLDLISLLNHEYGEHGNIEVLLHVTNHPDNGERTETECIGDIRNVTTEQDHDTEKMFVRISGDDEE